MHTHLLRFYLSTSTPYLSASTPDTHSTRVPQKPTPHTPHTLLTAQIMTKFHSGARQELNEVKAKMTLMDQRLLLLSC